MTDPTPAASADSTAPAWSWDAPLLDVPAAVDRTLRAVIDASAREFSGIDPSVDDAMVVLRDFVLNGGKRIRPLFAWAGVRVACEGEGCAPDALSATADPSAALRAVSSLEFIQACALLHDDIIDKSDTRRGSPTAHRSFAARHADGSWLGSAEHYGTSQAILTGDLAFAWADDLLADAGLTSAALRRARPVWRAMRSEVIAGQIMDVAVEARGSESVEDAFTVMQYKTASYTMARPLHLGAALAGASEATIERLRSIGHHVGIAFQLRDDQLGVFGDPSVTGKPSGDDLRSGKRTVLIAEALRALPEAQATTLRSGLGTASSEAEVDGLRELVVASGARDHIDTLIREHTNAARALLDDAPWGGTIAEELGAICDRLTTRTH